jgi:hypothetical protein
MIISYLKKSDSYFTSFVVVVMVFNATINNISAISWRSALLAEETGEPTSCGKLLLEFWVREIKPYVYNSVGNC